MAASLSLAWLHSSRRPLLFSSAWTTTVVQRRGVRVSISSRQRSPPAISSSSSQQQHGQQHYCYRRPAFPGRCLRSPIPAGRLFRSSSSSSTEEEAAAAAAAESSSFSSRDENNQKKSTTSTSTSSIPSKSAAAPAKFVDFPFRYHQELDIKIETLTNRGWGVGRVELPIEAETGTPAASLTNKENNNNNESNDNDNKKWVVMVPNVIPGETVRARIFRNHAGYSEADCVAVLRASPDRVAEPACALSPECGGCQLQHWRIGGQRAWKTASVQEALAQHGLAAAAVTVQPTVGTEHTVGYRSKLTPHFNAPARRRRGGPTTVNSNSDSDNSDSNNEKRIDVIGFQRQTSRQIIDVPSCPIATPEVNAKYQEVRAQLLAEPWKSKKGATLLFRQDNLPSSSSATSSSNNSAAAGVVVTTHHKDSLTTTVRGLNFTYQAGNFFQNNYHVLPLLVDCVVEHASAPATTAVDSEKNNAATATTTMTHLVDCYCGSGLFAISSAAHFDAVVGIEINDRAVAEAAANAAANRIANCQFRAARAEAIFADIDGQFPRDATAVVVDPPRRGCGPEFLEQLVAFGPRRIVYVSCDPATQARDAAGILAAAPGNGGNYEITLVQPFDLFPQTRHIECVMVLERKN